MTKINGKIIPLENLMMSIETDEKWYAIRVKSKHEDVVAFNLGSINLEILNPKLMQEKLVWGCLKMTTKPLFPGYLFAKFIPSRYLHLIQYTRGVRQVVCFGATPVSIDEEIIQGIRDRLNSEGYAEISKKSIVAGSPVEIQSGLLNGLNGVFEREMSDHKRAVVLLDIMGVRAQVITEKVFLQATA